MADIDLEAIVMQSIIESGARPAQVLARYPGAARLIITTPRQRRSKSFDWTSEEDQFLRDNYVHLTDSEIGAALGRSEHGVHIRRERELRLPARSKQPDELTANQIAEGLGVDVHAVMAWIDRGLLPGRRLNMGDLYRVCKRVTVLRFIVNWRNWIYFDPARVDQRLPRRTKHKYDSQFWAHAARLVQRARERWQDEWWTPGEVARYHKVCIAVVNNAVHDGRLTGVKWQNWRILKSVATSSTQLHSGRGQNCYRYYGDGFDELLIVGTAIGLSVNTLAAYSGLKTQAISYRRSELRRLKKIVPLIKTRGLQVEYTAKTGALFADWKRYRTRFTALAAAMDRFYTEQALSKRELAYVRGVLYAWADRYYHRRDRVMLLTALYTVGNTTAQRLRGLYERLRRAGIDPYQQVNR